MKKKGFTLLEVIVAVTSFFLLLVVIINIYSRMIKLKYNIQARTNVTQDSYYVIEKINLMLKDYTIDYEEYFNRKNVGCDNYNDNFIRDIGTDGYCKNFTAYGNNNNISGSPINERKIYFCSSATNESNPQTVILSPQVQNGGGCLNTGQQSFGQYRWQFWDVRKNADSVPGAWNDDDDENVMKGPSAIDNATGTQELYLISQDGKSRIFIRRALLESGDFNNDGVVGSGDSEKRYTLQILKLIGFDAGNNHDFDVNNSSGVYDGKIDTRACDYAQGFICNGTEINTILYSGFKIPSDQDDGRVDLFQKNITISDRNLTIYPTKNPQYALAENQVQINPYFIINITSKLYGQIRQKRLGMQNIDTFQINLQTTFNTKNFYTK
ncbi:MAG: type II secretion system protein [Candidatus Absconditabacterales bacterium]